MNPKLPVRSFRRVSAPVVFWCLLAPWALHSVEIVQAQELKPTQQAQGADAGSTLLIDPGDLLDVRIFDTPELSGKLRVSQSGSISLSQGGVLHVAGLSSLEAQDVIERRLRDAQIMLDPHVTVFVQEYASRGVVVLGEVKNPGTYTLLGGHSLYGALAAAGGVTPAEGPTITITRQNDPDHKEIVQVTSPNFSEEQGRVQINPGDTVFVSRAGAVYVLGDVAHPGAYTLPAGHPLKVLNLLSLAEGPSRTAALSKVSIIRTVPSGAETIPLDLKRIMKNTSPDPVLQASDILVVPSDTFKAFINTTIPGATGAVISAVVTALIVR